MRQQSINQTDIDAVVDVLRSNFLTQGPMVPEFEAAVANRCDVSHAVAVNSATSALHIACLALGVGPGDWLWTSPNTFVASANCGLYCGANVDFVDIDPQTYNLCAEALCLKLEQAEKENRLPKVVIPVHFAGQSCDMKRIKELSEQYNFKIIEDGSHAIGSTYRGKPVGNCLYSDITVFSFHPVKIITTGEGGMALTNDENYADRMVRLRTHGISRNTELISEEARDPWYYEQLDLGFNYRMTDIVAALGLSQLARIDTFIQRRREISKIYGRALKKLPLILPWQDINCSSSWHLYVIQVDPKRAPINRVRLFNSLRETGIPVNVHYIPIHTQPYYQSLGFRQGEFPEAERYYSRAISLPIYASLAVEEHDHVIETIEAIYSKYLTRNY